MTREANVSRTSCQGTALSTRPLTHSFSLLSPTIFQQAIRHQVLCLLQRPNEKAVIQQTPAAINMPRARAEPLPSHATTVIYFRCYIQLSFLNCLVRNNFV